MMLTASLRATALILFGLALPLSVVSTDTVPVVQGDHLSTVTANPFNSALQPCPALCFGKPENWTVYSSVERLAVCDQPLLFDFALYNPLDDPTTNVKLRVCTAGAANDLSNAAELGNVSAKYNNERLAPSLHIEAKRKSPAEFYPNRTEATLELALVGPKKYIPRDNTIVVLQEVQNFLRGQENWDTSVIFSYYGGTVVGAYSGAAIDSHNTGPSVIQRLIDQVKSKGLYSNMFVQLCGNGRSSDHVFGVAVDATGNIDSLSSMQRIVRSWSDGSCANTTAVFSPFQNVGVWEIPFALPRNQSLSTRRLLLRGDCRTMTVVPQDSCGVLASRCGISGADFMKYNPAPSLCATLQPGQRVCCTAGTLPDLTPKKNSDGSCATYTIAANDWCSKIAGANGLTVSQIEMFNKQTTWGWTGCSNIMVGLKICLSDGTPPMPAPMANAVCGPIKPGSLPVLPGKGSLRLMNQCPLNACCDIWGQCGIDETFCTDIEGPTGNPGTAPPGMNGCISNCGTGIINNGFGPGSFQSIGYYESWNWERPCLHLRAKSIDTSQYTHIHWAFAAITPNWNVVVHDTYQQFRDFINLKGTKRIISFGGWGYSTDPGTYDILRQAMSVANRDHFAASIAKFLSDYNLDGVDFDWEYPGAPDIPGVPPGLASDGPNYLAFLTLLRGKLPKEKSISIAAPASFWYLKAFPIAEMAKVLDYIVYMTYDLHGQWDYGNSWSSPGCPAGNCLRSHVNITETILVLAMVTKAGVPSNKINVGVSSYGRSFKMKDPNCATAMCQYLGPASQAAAGICTDTQGYISNAEIQDIIDNDKTVHTYHDKVSGADMLIYAGTDWVSYMSDVTKADRKAKYQSLNFGGTVDWAVDLQSFDHDDEGQTDEDQAILDGLDEELPLTTGLGPCSDSYTRFDQLDADVGKIPSNCQAVYVMQVLDVLLSDSLTKYKAIMANGYDHKFDVYSKAVVQGAEGQVIDFLNSKGNQYFTCSVTEMTMCCELCDRQYPGKDQSSQCKYCFQGGCKKNPTMRRTIDGRDQPPPPPGAVQTVNFRFQNVTEPCPPDLSARGLGDKNLESYQQSVYWTLSPDKADQFWTDLTAATGVPKDKIAFQDKNFHECGQEARTRQDCINTGGWYLGVPLPKGYDQAAIVNPKDTVAKALSNGQLLAPQIKDAIGALKANAYPGNPNDLIDAVALPVTMLADAVDQMQNVADIAAKAEKEQRNATILAFIGALLFVIPIAGEALGTLTAAATISRIILMAGAAGNAAFDIYTILKDPANRPLAIFDLVFAPFALIDVAAMAKAAGLRREMTADDIGKLGATIGKRMGTIEKFTGVCRRA